MRPKLTCQVTNVTDKGILPLSERCATLERIHLSYCEKVTVKAITELLNKLPLLTHLSLTGINCFKVPELQQFCRPAPEVGTRPLATATDHRTSQYTNVPRLLCSRAPASWRCATSLTPKRQETLRMDHPLAEARAHPPRRSCFPARPYPRPQLSGEACKTADSRRLQPLKVHREMGRGIEGFGPTQRLGATTRCTA